MDLRAFITQGLVDLVQGVAEAQSQLGENGKYVNPELSTQQGPLQQQGKHVSIQGQLVQYVEFDIAVTATAGTGTQGGIGVVTGVLSLGSHGKSSREQSDVSRIKFTVPLTLPYGDKMGKSSSQ